MGKLGNLLANATLWKTLELCPPSISPVAANSRCNPWYASLQSLHSIILYQSMCLLYSCEKPRRVSHAIALCEHILIDKRGPTPWLFRMWERDLATKYLYPPWNSVFLRSHNIILCRKQHNMPSIKGLYNTNKILRAQVETLSFWEFEEL